MAKADSILLSSRASAALLMVYGQRSALSRALHAGARDLADLLDTITRGRAGEQL
jgi:hypothetical protein